jgi:hypothetical protein
MNSFMFFMKAIEDCLFGNFGRSPFHAIQKSPIDIQGQLTDQEPHETSTLRSPVSAVFRSVPLEMRGVDT